MRAFANEHDFQLQIDDWFDTRANARQHKTLRCRPIDRLVEERAVMAPLRGPPDTDRRWVLRVPPDPYLRFDTCDYSLDRRPGSRGLANDLLGALGKDHHGLGWPGESRAWPLADLCLAAECVQHLVIYGAHRLTTDDVNRLTEIVARTRGQLWLVTRIAGQVDIAGVPRLRISWCSALPRSSHTFSRWSSHAVARQRRRRTSTTGWRDPGGSVRCL